MCEEREFALLAQVRLPQIRCGDTSKALPEAVLARPRVKRVEVHVEVAREQFEDGCPEPARPVDAVGHGDDVVVGRAMPGGVGGVGMELADRIRPVRQTEAEGGHVELATIAIRAQPEVEYALDRDPATVEQRSGDTTDDVGLEALVPGGDRGVDGEHGVFPDAVERRVALVEMPDRGLQPEFADGPDTADAQDEFLVQTHLAAAHIQDVGDRPILDRVLGDVRVEQQDRYATDLGEPDGDRQITPGQLDGHGQGQPVAVLDA